MRNLFAVDSPSDAMGATASALLAAAVVLLLPDPAVAQSVAVEAIPTGRFAGVMTSTLAYICITIGIVCVAFGILYGLFQMFYRQEGIATVLKSIGAGAFLGLVLPLAIWVVGSSPSTATLPEPGGFGGF